MERLSREATIVQYLGELEFHMTDIHPSYDMSVAYALDELATILDNIVFKFPSIPLNYYFR